KTPYEALWDKKPDLSHLHSWGCEVHMHSPGSSKLSSCAAIAPWVGFNEETDTHHIYWPD
ncbi:hypothetical protein BV20DRAFT_909015, partial [Pilatotrama ljubarskyi]